MGRINDILSQRFGKASKSKKMEEMSEASASGQLASFTGIFGSSDLSQTEQEELESLLLTHSDENADIKDDLKILMSLTSEVKAITHQAVILHGERIKKAQSLLKKYKEGAFTSWLITTYGNRQTPYNFLQYYEFYNLMPTKLHSMIERMPRQAIYTLASREGNEKNKIKIIERYQGETKKELLNMIREAFPLPEQDLRRQDIAENAISLLSRICSTLDKPKVKISSQQKIKLEELIEQVEQLLNSCKTA
jgi:hypothetical protein